MRAIVWVSTSLLTLPLGGCSSNSDHVTNTPSGGSASAGSPIDSGSPNDSGGPNDSGASTGGASSSAGSEGGIMPIKGKCDGLAPAGTWENITPAQLNGAKWCTPDFGKASDSCGDPGFENPKTGTIATYGAHSVALDPNHTGTAYLGTSSLGIWKTLDCGSSWLKSDTGSGSADLDSGRQWTFVVDPVESQVLYTTPGYGKEGLFKSSDGGTNWTQVFPSDLQASLPYGGWVEKISLDPRDHLHLVISFHIDCKHAPSGGHACADGSGNDCWACMAETPDGGGSWKPLTHGAQSWSEGDGQTVLAGSTWLYGAFGGNGASGGIWRTSNAGASWQQVYTGSASGAALIAKDGTYYVAGQGGLLHSSDGISWMPVANSPGGNTVNGALFIVDTGTTLYASAGQYGGMEPSVGWYSSAPDSNPSQWAPAFNFAVMDHGGSTLAYDPDHHLLYSANLTSGLWRVVIP